MHSARMKRSAIFINTARGAIHNETDLIEALQKGLIWGAGLDVTNPEPMASDNPLLDYAKCVRTPAYRVSHKRNQGRHGYKSSRKHHFRPEWMSGCRMS
jgi:phosphoglycerate dehydrogenase-like enzyme